MRTLCIVALALLTSGSALADPRPCARTGEDATDERTARTVTTGADDRSSWKSTAGMVALGVGAVLGVASPAVLLGGIALDDQPSTPPVEAFVLGAALGVAAVVAVISGGIARASGAEDERAARDATAPDCAS